MFTAAGKDYKNPTQLTVEKVGEYESKWIYSSTDPIYRDIHGRRTLHLRERFPCFDVYDRMYENRYFHWYFIEHAGGVTMVYTADDSSDVKVVEGVTRASIGKGGVTCSLYEELILCGFIREEKL